jgi:hypothetical protein
LKRYIPNPMRFYTFIFGRIAEKMELALRISTAVIFQRRADPWHPGRFALPKPGENRLAYPGVLSPDELPEF